MIPTLVKEEENVGKLREDSGVSVGQGGGGGCVRRRSCWRTREEREEEEGWQPMWGTEPLVDMFY